MKRTSLVLATAAVMVYTSCGKATAVLVGLDEFPWPSSPISIQAYMDTYVSDVRSRDMSVVDGIAEDSILDGLRGTGAGRARDRHCVVGDQAAATAVSFGWAKEADAFDKCTDSVKLLFGYLDCRTCGDCIAGSSELPFTTLEFTGWQPVEMGRGSLSIGPVPRASPASIWPWPSGLSAQTQNTGELSRLWK
jgi:hypothetical protein